MKIDKFHIVLILMIAGIFLYFQFCNEPDTLTHEQGKILAENSQKSIEMMWKVFEKLEQIDSSEIIKQYYNTVYETSIQHKDSIVALDSNMVYALFRLYRQELLSGQSPIIQP